MTTFSRSSLALAEARLRATVPTAKLARVEQIQNVTLWSRFYTERAIMAQQHGDGQPAREEELFHGTGSTPPQLIFNGQEGFDMRFSTAGLWGIASYFAVEAGYSNTDKYCFVNERGQRELLVAQARSRACGLRSIF